MDVPTEPSGGYLPMGVSVLDEEYSALMAELGEGAPKRKTGYAGGGGGGAGGPAANHEMEKPEPVCDFFFLFLLLIDFYF